VSAEDDLPDIKAYAEALVTSPEVPEKLTRHRFVAGYPPQPDKGGQGNNTGPSCEPPSFAMGLVDRIGQL
jgi:hypothetical protein